MESPHLNLITPWSEVKEKIKEINSELTDADLAYEPGQEKELLERLSKKMHRDVDAIKEWIESVSFTRNIAS